MMFTTIIAEFTIQLAYSILKADGASLLWSKYQPSNRRRGSEENQKMIFCAITKYIFSSEVQSLFENYLMLEFYSDLITKEDNLNE